jgi:hypothetical protein
MPAYTDQGEIKLKYDSARKLSNWNADVSKNEIGSRATLLRD